MQQPAKYVSVSRHKKASGVDEVPLSQQEFDRLAKDNFRDAHRAYAAEKNKVVQQCRPFALDDEDASTLMVPVSDEIKLSAEEFKKQAQENYLSSMSAYQGQKDKTVTSTGSKECFSPPEGPKISEFVAEVASNDMPFDKFMAEAASNRAQASNVFRQQMGRVRQSSMASPEKIPEDPQLLGRVGDGATRAHHALWRQKRDKRFMETEYAQSEEEFAKLSSANFRKANKAYLEQKQKTVVGNFDPLAAPEGAADVPDPEAGPPKMSMEEFMAQAAANRAEARAAYEFQKGKVRQSSM